MLATFAVYFVVVIGILIHVNATKITGNAVCTILLFMATVFSLLRTILI